VINECKTCVHKNICCLKTHIKHGPCNDHINENKFHKSKFGVYETVYFIDRFDLDNDCSQIGDGTGSKNIELVVRECFITNIVIHDASENHLYFIQPRKLTQYEANVDKSFYWEGSRYEKSLFATLEDAVNYLKNECGYKEVIIK
jgi:hypothetical protein